MYYYITTNHKKGIGKIVIDRNSIVPVFHTEASCEATVQHTREGTVIIPYRSRKLRIEKSKV